jgi:uncharacterized protein YhjY with autotransporter beta-barrel domain
MSRLFLVTIVTTLVLASLDAAASSRTGLVFKSGEVRFVSTQALTSRTAQADCEDNPDLAFRFNEQVSTDSLRLEERRLEEAEIELQVSIELVCGSGSATFEYGHSANNGGSTNSVSIAPMSPLLTVSLAPGASQSVRIQYAFSEERLRSASYTLFGNRVTFIIDGAFGQTGQRRDLASIEFLGDPIDASRFDPDIEPRIRDAADAFNNACLVAPSGSSLERTCDEIREFATTDDQMRQVANAFDANALTNVPRASGEGGRLQTENIADRIHTLRGVGGGGFSMSGLTLNMNGQTITHDWLPLAVRSNADGDDRSATLFGSRWGVFLNGNISVGKRKQRNREAGFDFDSWGITSGVDYRFDQGHIVGTAIGFSRYQSDLANDGGKLDGDTWSFQGFGSIALAEDFYIDLTLGYAETDFDQQRVIDLSGIGNLTRHMTMGSTSTDEWSTSISLNYRLRLDNGWNLTPYGEFYYADISIDGFTETGSVFSFRFPDQNIKSKLWSAGLRASRAVSLNRGVMLPYADLAWQYESGIDGYTIQPVLMSAPAAGAPIMINDPDRHFARFDAGVSWVLHSGTQFFASYSGLLFERDTTRHTVHAGARWEF